MLPGFVSVKATHQQTRLSSWQGRCLPCKSAASSRAVPGGHQLHLVEAGLSRPRVGSPPPWETHSAAAPRPVNTKPTSGPSRGWVGWDGVVVEAGWGRMGWWWCFTACQGPSHSIETAAQHENLGVSTGRPPWTQEGQFTHLGESGIHRPRAQPGLRSPRDFKDV